MITYVLDMDKKPLMPTFRHKRVKKLLKTGQAKVVRRLPFTIQLLYETEGKTQPLTLGIDTGSGVVGAAVSDDKGQILYMSEVVLRNDIKDKMDRRRKYRKARRNRKTRYRKPRFNNRRNSIRSDRLSPTLKSKLDSHIKEIETVKKLLPVSQIVIETGKFDIHRLENPELKPHSEWGYQHGRQYGFSNTRAYVLDRDNYSCQVCGKTNAELQIHHLVPRVSHGSDLPQNLVCVCKKCHGDIHKGKLKFEGGEYRGKLKHALQMNVLRSQLLDHYLPEGAIETFGYVTKENSICLGIKKKAHHIDACIISTGGKPFVKRAPLIEKECISDGYYKKTKGMHSEHKTNTGKVYGLRIKDKVSYRGAEYHVLSRSSTGYLVLGDIYGNKADFSNEPRGYKTPKASKCKRITARRSVIMQISKKKLDLFYTNLKIEP